MSKPKNRRKQQSKKGSVQPSKKDLAAGVTNRPLKTKGKSRPEIGGGTRSETEGDRRAPVSAGSNRPQKRVGSNRPQKRVEAEAEERTGLRQLFKEVNSELRKVVWPSGRETTRLAFLVLISIGAMTLGIWVADVTFSRIVTWILGTQSTAWFGVLACAAIAEVLVLLLVKKVTLQSEAPLRDAKAGRDDELAVLALLLEWEQDAPTDGETTFVRRLADSMRARL